jgi:hypothetical protein
VLWQAQNRLHPRGGLALGGNGLIRLPIPPKRYEATQGPALGEMLQPCAKYGRENYKGKMIAALVPKTGLGGCFRLTCRPMQQFIREAHLSASPYSKRSNSSHWAFPLAETDMPFAPAEPTAARLAGLNAIVSYLDVAHSPRYQPGGDTYCNIYACDYCYLAGVYLPRVWWLPAALAALEKREKVEPIYGKTVAEVSANGLYTWLHKWGAAFGWQHTTSLDMLQAKVNSGKVGLICGQSAQVARSGHIACVLPEAGKQTATYRAGKVHCPLLSQAGAINRPYYNNARWWLQKGSIRAYGFWYA